LTTFSQLELSEHSGTPVELYLFSNGDQVWAVTNAEEEIIVNLTVDTNTATKVFVTGNPEGSASTPDVIGDIVFKPLAIQRTEVSNTSELNKSYINIAVPRDFDVASLYTFYPPSSITAVTVFRYHRGTVAVESNLFTEFLGRVVNASGAGITTELRCEPITTSIRRIGLTQMYQRQCPHTLYNQSEGNCKAVKASFAENRNLHSGAGLVGLTMKFSTPLIETGKGVGYYNGGMVYWKTGNYTYWRWILEQPEKIDNVAVDDTIIINFPVPILDVDGVNPLPWQGGNKQVTLYPGCAHTMTDCRVKFNNLNNYGGAPYIPLMNPFGANTLNYS
jgi:hypothetical protein